MPIPELVWIGKIDDWLFYKRRIGKTEKFSWLPRRCYLSGKSLFLKKAIVVTGMVTGPGDIQFTDFWCDSKEFFLSEFKRGK